MDDDAKDDEDDVNEGDGEDTDEKYPFDNEIT